MQHFNMLTFVVLQHTSKLYLYTLGLMCVHSTTHSQPANKSITHEIDVNFQNNVTYFYPLTVKQLTSHMFYFSDINL